MKFKLSAVRKLKAIGALAVVFLMVLATNQMDSKHFKTVKRTLATVYEDRLVANDYLYKIKSELNQKHLSLYNSGSGKLISNDSISKLVNKYATTELTMDEKKYLDLLKIELQKLYQLEFQTKSTNVEDSALAANFELRYATIYDYLNRLSKIQLEEGAIQIQQSNKAISTVN